MKHDTAEPSVTLEKRKRKPGAGRKRKEPTMVTRIPVALATAVNELLERYKKGEPLFPESPTLKPAAPQTITYDLPIPLAQERKKPSMKYLMVVDGINHVHLMNTLRCMAETTTTAPALINS